MLVIGAAGLLWACGVNSYVKLDVDIQVNPDVEGAYTIYLPLPKITPYPFSGSQMLPEIVLAFRIQCEHQNLRCSLERKEKALFLKVKGEKPMPFRLYFPPYYSRRSFSPFTLFQAPASFYRLTQGTVRSFWLRVSESSFLSARQVKSFTYIDSNGGNVHIRYRFRGEKTLFLGVFSAELRLVGKTIPALGKQPLLFLIKEEKKLWL